MQKLSTLLLVLLSFVACNDNNDTEGIKPNIEAKLVFEEGANLKPVIISTAGGATVSFTSSLAWEATVDESSELWCSLSESTNPDVSGIKVTGIAGKSTLTIAALENMAELDRTASITITVGEITQVIALTQIAKNADVSLVFEEGTDFKPVIASAAGADTINFTSSLAWEATVDESSELWCSLSESTNPDVSGIKVAGIAGKSMLTIKALENMTELDRTASITITMGEITQVIVLTQTKALIEADTAFNDYLIEEFDTDKDGEISTEEASKVIKIDCSFLKINSLVGIEQFVNLEELICKYNFIKSIDFSKNQKLTTLNCSQNQIKSLDFSKNQNLITLDCSANLFTDIDSLKGNKLVTLDCSMNQLTDVDLSTYPDLRSFICTHNIASIDLSESRFLEVLMIKYLRDEPFHEIDLSACVALKHLELVSANLRTLDVSKCIELKEIHIDYNNLTEIDFSNNTKIEVFWCISSKFKTLDLSMLTELKQAMCDENALTHLDVSGCHKLTLLWCGENQLTTMKTLNAPLLENLEIDANKFTEFDLSGCPKLESLECQGNQITTLDIWKNPKLSMLKCVQSHAAGLETLRMKKDQTVYGVNPNREEVNIAATTNIVFN